MSYNWERDVRNQEKELEAQNLKRAEERLQSYRAKNKKMMCDCCNKFFSSFQIEVAESNQWISYGFFCKDCLK